MKTLLSPVERGLTYDLDLRSPLSQAGLVWATMTPGELNAAQSVVGLRRVDPGGIFALTEHAIGPVDRWVVLGDNVIGATGWSGVSLDEQYEAVNTKAAAFIASAMLYLRIKGRKSAALLDSLSPRTVSDLDIGGARFCLFTTPAGTVDEEAVVIRTGHDEFLMSCGGGKPPTWLYSQAEVVGDVTIAEANIFSFNIKGPRRLLAIQRLVADSDADALAALRPFRSCMVHTAEGGDARIVRTIIGYEMWAEAETLRAAWRHLLDSRSTVTPAGWDLLNIYRVECPFIVFGLYPLDLHGGTKLDEVGFDWMRRDADSRQFIGSIALRRSDVQPRFWLAGLESTSGIRDVPLIGREVVLPNRDFVGYVTTAASSPRHGGPLAFAHLALSCEAGSIVNVDDQPWVVRRLPFWND